MSKMHTSLNHCRVAVVILINKISITEQLCTRARPITFSPHFIYLYSTVKKNGTPKLGQQRIVSFEGLCY